MFDAAGVAYPDENWTWDDMVAASERIHQATGKYGFMAYNDDQMGYWNVVNSDLKIMTLSSGLATLRGQFTTNFPVLMAGSLLAMLPMVILYLIFQRQFSEGIASTGGK